ncbi:MAG: hypothetical protein V3S24_10000, partial [Candidatus Tectomicrobia bacterium]
VRLTALVLVGVVFNFDRCLLLHLRDQRLNIVRDERLADILFDSLKGVLFPLGSTGPLISPGFRSNAATSKAGTIASP